MDLYSQLDRVTFDSDEEKQRLIEQQREQEDRVQEAINNQQSMLQEVEDKKAAEQKIEDEKHIGDRILDTPVVGQVASVGAGVVDTALDVAGLVPWLKPIEESWDEYHGRDRETNPINKFIRDASAIVIPTLTGGGAIAKGAQGLALAGKLGKGVQAASTLRRTQVLGAIATDLGVSTAVEAVSEQTDEPGNLATALENMLGVQIPWASRDGDSPDVIRAKNLGESFGLGGFVGLIDAFFSLKPAVQLIAKDDAAKQIIGEKIFKDNVDLEAAGGDNLVATVMRNQAAREEAITDEALRRFNTADGEYDPYVNLPSFEMERPVMNYQPDPVMAKVDYVRIKENIGTTDGVPNPVITDYYKLNVLNSDAPGRDLLLDDLARAARPQFAARIKTAKGTTTISADKINKTLDEVVEAATKLNPKEFESLIKKTLSFTDDQVVVQGKKFSTLTTAGANEVTEILKRGLDLIDPEKIRAAGQIAVQTANDQATLGKAIDAMGDTLNTTSQQELFFDNYALLIREIGVHKTIAGNKLNNLKFLKDSASSGKLDADWIANEVAQFDRKIMEKTKIATGLGADFKKIAKQNPEYLKPFMREAGISGGDINSLHALNKLVENRLGVIKKSVGIGDKSIPSNVVRELQTARYNSVLTGLAPVRAATGAAIALVGKPLTVFVGSAGGRVFGGKEGLAAWKRAMYTYGGVFENFQRGMKNLKTEWKYALDNPRASVNHSRKDFQVNALDDYETLEALSSQWYEKGEFGKVAIWNMTKVLSRFNDHPIPRFGINSMRALDGFTRSFTASMAARSKAYDDLLSQSSGVLDDLDFQKMQRELYNNMFDADGLMKSDAANVVQNAADFAAGEINLNLDSAMVGRIDKVLNDFPVLRSIFMFPRTGVNALQLAATFSPGNAIAAITDGNLNFALGKARRLFSAKTNEEIADVMAEHGLAGYGSEAFRQLKSEYTGRYMMGSAVTMGAALMAAQGLITGSGPQDAGELRRMKAMGYKQFSITNPLTGESRSYQGLEPFDTFLGLTADIVQKFNRTDQAVTEDLLRAVAHSITMNVSQKSFLSGFEPLAGLISGDISEFERFFALTADTTLPGAGIRSILNKVITPQLKDIDYNFKGYLANRNKWLVGESLEDFDDIYTGKPINYLDPLTNAVNAFLPFFKTNPGMEDWRRKLLASGWDNLQTVRRNRSDNSPLLPTERQFINNWIGSKYRLDKKVEALFNQPDSYWEKEMRAYAKARGLNKQEEFPAKKTVLFDELDRIHNQAYEDAFIALELSNSDYADRKHLKTLKESLIAEGKYEEASKVQQQIKELLQKR